MRCSSRSIIGTLQEISSQLGGLGAFKRRSRTEEPLAVKEGGYNNWRQSFCVFCVSSTGRLRGTKARRRYLCYYVQFKLSKARQYSPLLLLLLLFACLRCVVVTQSRLRCQFESFFFVISLLESLKRHCQLSLVTLD